MANKLNFTKAAIAALAPAPTGKRIYYNDTRVRGLQLQVTANGTKTFYLYRRLRNGPPKRFKLGRHPEMTPALARTQAEICAGQISKGEDPTARRRLARAESVALADASAEFIAVRSLTPKTQRDYRNVMNRAFADWQAKPLRTLTKDKVARRHQQLGKNNGTYYANQAMRILRAVYNFAAAHYEDAEGNSLLPPNPVQRISATRTWFPEKRRDNYITEPQLPAWFRAVLAHKANAPSAIALTVADYLLLVILTGLRNREAATLTWSHVDLDNKTLIVRDTKNHEDHTLPLSDFLYELLSVRRAAADTQWVFPSDRADTHLVEPRKHLAKIISTSGVQFTIHDLRRTFVTYAERLDISAYAVKRLVNHKMRQDVTARYIGPDVERLRKPMQAITDFLLKAGEVKASSIVRLNRPQQGGGER